MIDLDEFIEPLKRFVAVPGEFETVFPNTDDTALLGLLEDGFAEAQLDGMLKGYVVDAGVASPVNPEDPDLTAGQTSLIGLYAAVRLVRAQLLNRVSHRRYVGAGGVTFEEDYGINLLRDILSGLQAQKQRLLEAAAAGEADAIGGFFMADQYAIRAWA